MKFYNQYFSYHCFFVLLLDIDYCASNPCKNQGACQDGIGSYHCVCQTGFVGSDCQYPVDQCNPNPCAEGSTCQNIAGSYRCACPEGRYGPKCDSKGFYFYHNGSL